MSRPQSPAMHLNSSQGSTMPNIRSIIKQIDVDPFHRHVPYLRLGIKWKTPLSLNPTKNRRAKPYNSDANIISDEEIGPHVPYLWNKSVSL